MGNDVETLDSLFHDDPRTIRYGGGENLYGFAEIAAFRVGRSPQGLARALSRTVITTYGRDFAVASTLFRRPAAPGRARPADAELGGIRRCLEGGRRSCQRDRRAATGRPGMRRPVDTLGIGRRARKGESAAQAMLRPRKTHAERLRLQLSDEIVRGELAPGIALDEMELAQRFTMSRAPPSARRSACSSRAASSMPGRTAAPSSPGRTRGSS